jgi:hypothetical protein
MVEVKIVPKDFVKTWKIHILGISLVELMLNETATFQVDLLTEGGIELADRVRIQLSKEEYDMWGDSDQYIENLVLDKLGFQRYA